jgi:tRNA pseudouridine38-40 synthase
LSETRNILLFVQWDGTDFHGWQFQPEQRTVQGELATALTQMVHHEVDLFASSRTDAGVHARAMPVNFETSRPIAPINFVKGLNTFLPRDCSVLEAREVPLGWRARDQAVAKTYTYRVQLGSRRALTERFVWALKRESLDFQAMREAASLLIGEHDFSAFRAAQCDSLTTMRRIYRLDVSDPDPDEVVSIVVTGNAFMRNMVRILAGTLVEVGTGRKDVAWVGRVLAERDRTRGGPTAPARGLTLTTVHFEGYPRLGKRSSQATIESAASADDPEDG